MLRFIQPVRVVKAASVGSKRKWIALSIAQHGAAVFDAWTTRRKLSGGGYHESNPLLKPFAGNNSLYAVTQITPAALDLLGNRMRKSERPWVRRLWWLPQAAQTAMQITCGATNLAK